MRAALGPEPIRARQESASKIGSSTILTACWTTRSRTLAIPSGRCLPGSRLGNPDPPHRLRTVGPRPQRRLDLIQERRDPSGFDIGNGDGVDTRGTPVGTHSNHARRSTSLRWTRSNSAWNLRSGDRLAARYSLCCRARFLSRVLLAPAMHRLLPVKQAQTKQGPFAAAGYVVLAGDHYYDPLRRPPGPMRLPVRRLSAPAAPGPQARGRAGPLQFPPPPSIRSAPHYGGGFLALHLQDLTPSIAFALLLRARLPLVPSRGWTTPRQASLHAADRRLLPPTWLSTLGSDAGRFPPTPPACYQGP